jgi:hypothetical protein
LDRQQQQDFNRNISTNYPNVDESLSDTRRTTKTTILTDNNIVTRSREMLDLDYRSSLFVDDDGSTNTAEAEAAADVELHSLSGGQIADLCKLQKRCWQAQIDTDVAMAQVDGESKNSNDDDDNDDDDGNDKNNSQSSSAVARRRRRHLPPYTPIHPYLLPSSSIEIASLVEKIEPGRIDVRVHALKQELLRYGYIP